MSILKTMLDSQQSDCPCYMEFLLKFNPKKRQVFAFYEGDEDSSYYHQYIEGIVGCDTEIVELVAGCKKNVLKLHAEFDWAHYDQNQIAFFVDRDLSFWLNEEQDPQINIYVTDGYSIENFLICEHVFKRALKEVVGFSRARENEIDRMVAVLCKAVEEYEQKIVPVMARATLGKAINRDIDLSAYKASVEYLVIEGDILLFELQEIPAKILEDWRVAHLTKAEIDEQIDAFRQNQRQYHVRGKWVLNFVSVVLSHFREMFEIYAPSLSAPGKRRLRAKCEFGRESIMSVLAPRCSSIPPESLSRFFQNTYCRYVAFPETA